MTLIAGHIIDQAAGLVGQLLTETCTVYGKTPATGQWTTVLLTDVACRVVPVQGGTTAQDRTELLAMRDFWFDPAVTIPEGSRLEVAGHLDPDGSIARWSIRSGTLRTVLAGNGTPLYRACDLVSVK